MTAYVEKNWGTRIKESVLFRYEMPVTSFTDLGDAGMHVARTSVKPLSCEHLSDLTSELAAAKVELRNMASLTPLRDVWSSTLHVSGIRLRNAVGWAKNT